MHKYMAIFLLFVMLSVAGAKIIRADVTNDGVDDVLKMGMKIVTVQDGASNKLHTIVAGIENLADISVDNYFSGTKGNEIALLRLEQEKYFTEVYGYRNKRFIKVSDTLPGELSFDGEGRLFGYTTYGWDRSEVLIYWPILEAGGYLQATEIVAVTETSLVAESRSTKTLAIELQENTFTMCVASTLDDDVVVFLLDENGMLIKQNVIDPKTGFYGRIMTEHAKVITFNIDNSRSPKARTVHVIVKQYSYP
jgi:hypothetical protein